MVRRHGLGPRRSAGEMEAATLVRTAKTSHFASPSSRVALTQAERTGAIRVGWNDAAWGYPRRMIPPGLAACYEQGYAGGLVFRRQNRAIGC